MGGFAPPPPPPSPPRGFGGPPSRAPRRRPPPTAPRSDWAFTTPLLLLDLGLLAGATLPEIGFVVIMDLIMIATGFAGAVSSGHHATWPLFVFGA